MLDRRKLLRMSTMAGAVGVGVVAAPPVAQGETARATRVPGLWQVDLMIKEQQRLERALWRLSEDGTSFHSSDNGATGLGSWSKPRQNAFTVAYRGFVLTSTGELEGQLQVRDQCVFTGPGTFGITAEATFFTPDGVELGTFHATGTGTRVKGV